MPSKVHLLRLVALPWWPRWPSTDTGDPGIADTDWRINAPVDLASTRDGIRPPPGATSIVPSRLKFSIHWRPNPP